MKFRHLTLCLILAFASAAFAHSGVKNPAVMARMEAMKGIGDEMKVLGQMAKGQVAFDAAAAQGAARAIAGYAAETPALFEAREDDPKSEARAAIWENFTDFTEKSDVLQQQASALAEKELTRDGLKTAMQQLGKTCIACHKPYRE